jgi:predicted Kef-type K+ transport protein
MTGFTFGVIVSLIVAITGSTEIGVLFALTALGARLDDVHLPGVKREPIYALGGYVAGWILAELVRAVPIA